MSKTERLGLPYILQAQAQKEVTHNQALNRLDVFVNTVAEDIVDAPPTTANDGDIYIVGDNPQGIFEGNVNNLAQFTGGSWTFYQPLNYMEVMIALLKQKFIFIANEWTLLNSSTILNGDIDRTKSDRTNSKYLKIEDWQEDLNLSGKVVSSKNIIPDHSLVIAVNIWVIEEITGVPSFTVGVKEDPSRYGDKLKPTKDTTNIGMTYHPITYYYDTPITIMPNQMEFKSGMVRVSVQYLKPRGSWGW